AGPWPCPFWWRKPCAGARPCPCRTFRGAEAAFFLTGQGPLTYNYRRYSVGSRRGFAPGPYRSLGEGAEEVKTYMAKPGEVERVWYVLDAKGKSLGRVASRAAAILRGKHKPQFTPH